MRMLRRMGVEASTKGLMEYKLIEDIALES